jgi:hypothetical protein
MSETFWVALRSIGTTLAFGGVVWQAYLARGARKGGSWRTEGRGPSMALTHSPAPMA